MKMHTKILKAKIKTFSLPAEASRDTSVIIPTVKGNWCFKYAKHAYYFINFKTLEGMCVEIPHSEIIKPGLERFKKVFSFGKKSIISHSAFTKKFHYGFNTLEQIMLMTVPHAVTSIGDGRFIINLWSYFGYIMVDCKTKSVTYHITEEKDFVLGSEKWFDPETKEVYGMSYSLEDSFSRIKNPKNPVFFRIFKTRIGSDVTETVWEGELADYMHDIVINKNREYCAVCELGMYLDEKNDIIPSKVLIMNLKNKKEWILDHLKVAAHAQFDPNDTNTIYLSNHNFEFQHSTIFQLMKKAAYSVKFREPASIHKYHLTPEGPKSAGIFSHPDFYRLTNMHTFNHRGMKIIAAMGFPDELFIINADTMSFIKKIHVKEQSSFQNIFSNKPAMIGTISPSPDGEKLFVQTTKSFQVINLENGEAEYSRNSLFNHSCSNHMLTSTDTSW